MARPLRARGRGDYGGHAVLKIGDCVLGRRPAVVAAVRDGMPRADIEWAASAGVDIFELRLDLFSGMSPEHAEAEAARFAGFPVLATIRAAREGGRWDGDEKARLDLYRRLLPLAHAVDVELSSTDIAGEVAAAARAAGRVVIGSFHDFSATPPDGELDALAGKADELGADILKVAAHCADAAELRRLAAFALRCGPRPAAVIGMGPAGMISRVFFPALGSLLTYTFLGAPSAPGQLNLEDTVRYLKTFYGWMEEGG